VSCFPKDILKALQYLNKAEENQKSYILDATIHSNKMRSKEYHREKNEIYLR
jgi:UDP-glucose 6-dehydrogenase